MGSAWRRSITSGVLILMAGMPMMSCGDRATVNLQTWSSGNESVRPTCWHSPAEDSIMIEFPVLDTDFRPSPA